MDGNHAPRVVAMANMGDSPELMLNAPVPAAKKVLEKAGLKKEDIDLWEINEAFAVVAEKFIRDLDLDREESEREWRRYGVGSPNWCYGVHSDWYNVWMSWSVAI